MAAPEASDCQHFFDTYLNDLEDGVEPYVVLFEKFACGGEHFSLRLKNGQLSSIMPDWQGLLGSLHVPKHIDLIFKSKQIEDHLDGEPSHEGTYQLTGTTLVDVHSDLSTRYATWSHPEDVRIHPDVTHPTVLMHPGEVDGVSPGTPVVLSFRSSDTLIDDVLKYKPKENFKSERTSVATDGTIDRLQTRRNREWKEVQFDSCTGTEPLIVAGQEINRYKPGSEFCTQFVRRICNEDPKNREQCACHQEQRELPLELSAVDFGQRCQQAAYIPPELKETQFNGPCDEAIQKHSDALDRMGYVDVHCRGETYNVDEVLEAHESRRKVQVMPLVLTCMLVVVLLIGGYYIMNT